MPKILLIQPTQYGTDGKLCKQNRLYLPSLSFPLLAAMTPPNWEVETIFEVIEDIDYDSDADIVGIGSMGHATFRGFEIGKEFKKRGKTVVFGGYMISIATEFAEGYDFIDSIIVGDAEKSYPMMLEDYEKHGKLKKTYDNPIDNLNDLPLPKYELLTKKSIGSMLPVQAGRGCPHSCSFCAINCLYKGKYMFRPVNDVIRDIKRVKELGFKEFYLIDDNIVGNPKYFKELCIEIKKLNMRWSSQCSILLANNPELLRIGRESGIQFLSFGIESITQKGLNNLNKAWLKVDNHMELLSRITESGIAVSSEMFFGTDSDTEESIRKTFDFIMETRIPVPRFYILTPTPGTEMFREYKEKGRLLTEDLSKFTGTQAVHEPKLITAEKLEEMFWWLNRKVFSVKNILKRTLFNPAIRKNPGAYIFAFFVNMHYRKYVKKGVAPNIF